jgi:3-hydroxyisobutyrate dehydrogenase
MTPRRATCTVGECTANQGAEDERTAMTAERSPVAIFGIGTMGRGMADSLLRAGMPTTVWDRNPAATAGLTDQGATATATARDAARAAPIAITMVPDATAVLSIADDEGMLAALPPNAIWAQMSTVGVAGTDHIAALVADRRPDVLYVDAPVSGSKAPAEEGKLTIFASGPDAAQARLDPVFDAMGQRTMWVGPAGFGSRLKLVNNTMLAFAAEGVAESLSLAHGFGLTTQTVIDAIGNGPLSSPWASAKMQRILHGEYSAEFALALALKDVRLALDAAEADRLPVTAQLASTWQDVVDRGLGQQDVTVVTRALDESGAKTGVAAE